MKPNKDYYAPMHTAEHILNATMVKMFGCKRSFSNHIERKKSKCDYHFNRQLLLNEIELIQKTVNEIINHNIDVTSQIVPINEAISFVNLEKLPDKNVENIRIVKIGNYDECACIGAHVKNTSEIGKFLITTTNFDNGVLRIRYKLT